MTSPQARQAISQRTASKMPLVLHVLGVVLISAYPLSLVLRGHLGVVPIGLETFAWVLAVDIMLAAALFLVLRLVTKDVAARAAWLGVFFLLFGGYSVVLQLTAALQWPLRPERPVVALGYTLVSALVATVTVRPWKQRRRDPIPLLIVGVVLVGANASLGIAGAASFLSATSGTAGGWKPATTALLEQAASAPPTHVPPSRDIYYVILDGLGDAETLRRLYGLDLGDFVTFLTARGFHVVPHARSNYAQTFLSLASTLNLGYLDGVAGVMGRQNADRTPLAHLIDHNALMSMAKRAGYQVVGIGSDYIATEQLPAADICRCVQYGSGSTEQAVFASTPLVAISLGPRAFHAHRQKVMESFREIEQPPSSAKRSFVFAHIIAPHPPFVFEADGSSPGSFRLFMFQDGNQYPGTREDYHRGYREQASFVARRLRAMVDNLLSRPGPAPVVIFHGDHGPGLGLNWDSVERTDTAERMGIFAAYYLPDARQHPYATMTPVNGARLLANEYFGTNLPWLEDKSFFSTWSRPYELVPVPAKESARAR